MSSSTTTPPGLQPSGRLELTWTNKPLRLLSDEAVGYTWVEPADFRVAEVRLLHGAATVGKVSKGDENLLVRGDALHALTSLLDLPGYRARYAGKVKLCYIDPPFNTGQAFEHYDDALEHSVWLTMLRDRLVQIRHLLSPSGAVWLHLDNMEVHRARCVLDEVFGASNYLGTVVWQRTSAKSLARRTMGTMHESILVYGASAEAELRTVYLPLTEDYVARRFTQHDERGSYDTGDLTASSYRPHLDSGKPWRGFDPSSIRRCWAIPRSPLLEIGVTAGQLARMSMREKLDTLDAAGYIHFPDRGGFPRLKKYVSRIKGRAVGDIWTDINVINSQAAERTGFATQKPEALIQRILTMGSDEGDLVLDCFAGSGTTAAVAHKLRRRWITVEQSPETLAKFTLPRLKKVVEGADPAGVTAVASWAGGGGFRVLDVAPSMFEAIHGVVFLSEWATTGRLAETTAAQLGYAYDPDGPFSGRKGRARLAVVDGVVNESVVRMLVDALAEGEILEVAATSVDDGAATVARELRRGSKVRKIPQAILRSYQRTSRLRELLPPSERDISDARPTPVPPATQPEDGEELPERETA